MQQSSIICCGASRTDNEWHLSCVRNSIDEKHQDKVWVFKKLLQSASRCHLCFLHYPDSSCIRERLLTKLTTKAQSVISSPNKNLLGFLCVPSRQQGSSIHVRHHCSWSCPRRHFCLQPRQPEPVWLWPREAGIPRPGGGLEVGRLLSWCQVWRGVFEALCGRAGDQEKRQAANEPAQ